MLNDSRYASFVKKVLVLDRIRFIIFAFRQIFIALKHIAVVKLQITA